MDEKIKDISIYKEDYFNNNCHGFAKVYCWSVNASRSIFYNIEKVYATVHIVCKMHKMRRKIRVILKKNTKCDIIKYIF